MVKTFNNSNELWVFLKTIFETKQNGTPGWIRQVTEAKKKGPRNLPEIELNFLKNFIIFDSGEKPIHEKRYLSILNDYIKDTPDDDGGDTVYDVLSEKFNEINEKYKQDMEANPPQDGWPWDEMGDEDGFGGGGYKSISSKRRNSKRRNSKRKSSKRINSKRRSSKCRSSKRRSSKRGSSKRRNSKRRM
jgi:hypothetical protein